MASNKYMIQISIRLVLIFLTMLGLTQVIGHQARLFTVVGLSLILLLLIAELFRTITRTNRTVASLIEAIRYNDFNKKLREKARGLGFEDLAESAQKIITAIASAKIEKETQYQYLQSILEHIHTPVLTLGEDQEPELINPLALHTLGIYSSKSPSWKQIRKQVPHFASTVEKLGPAGRQMIRLNHLPRGRQLLVLVNSVKLAGKNIRIVTFQDIEPEIEQKELESWRTISRIMAHEIMNSLTPLSSLTETGIMLLEKEGKVRKLNELSEQTIRNLHQALRTISDRNRALTSFIDNYRQLSRLPDPELQEELLSGLLEEISELYRLSCQKLGIELIIRKGPAMRVSIDPAQMKQVLINLIKNASEALEGRAEAQISLSAKKVHDQACLEIADNGPGIAPEILEKIFVPFYSTKSGGSGIGLSLSRQIISKHEGQLTVASEMDRGSVFRIWLPLLSDT